MLARAEVHLMIGAKNNVSYGLGRDFRSAYLWVVEAGNDQPQRFDTDQQMLHH